MFPAIAAPAAAAAPALGQGLINIGLCFAAAGFMFEPIVAVLQLVILLDILDHTTRPPCGKEHAFIIHHRMFDPRRSARICARTSRIFVFR